MNKMKLISLMLTAMIAGALAVSCGEEDEPPASRSKSNKSSRITSSVSEDDDSEDEEDDDTQEEQADNDDDEEQDDEPDSKNKYDGDGYDIALTLIDTWITGRLTGDEKMAASVYPPEKYNDIIIDEVITDPIEGYSNYYLKDFLVTETDLDSIKKLIEEDDDYEIAEYLDAAFGIDGRAVLMDDTGKEDDDTFKASLLQLDGKWYLFMDSFLCEKSTELDKETYTYGVWDVMYKERDAEVMSGSNREITRIIFDGKKIKHITDDDLDAYYDEDENDITEEVLSHFKKVPCYLVESNGEGFDMYRMSGDDEVVKDSKTSVNKADLS